MARPRKVAPVAAPESVPPVMADATVAVRCGARNVGTRRGKLRAGQIGLVDADELPALADFVEVIRASA